MLLRSILPALALGLVSCVSSTKLVVPMKRTAVNLPGTSLSAVYSNAVWAGSTLYLSGKLGIDPETGQIPSDVGQEIRLILDGLQEVLAEAELTMDDLVSVTVFCTDPALYDQFNSIYAEYFTGTFPARAFIGSGPLLRGAHFEVKGIAVRQS
ncbi:MAG: RidA family protein [Planctomycetota bacterium]